MASAPYRPLISCRRSATSASASSQVASSSRPPRLISGVVSRSGLVDEVVAEPPLDAEPALVPGPGLRGDPDDLVVLHVGRDVAPRAAVRADRVDGAGVLEPALARPELARQRAGRADRDALAAELAVQVLLVGGADLGLEAAVAEVDRLDALDLVADLDAAAAEDALLQVPLDEGVAVALRVGPPLAGVLLPAHAVGVGELLERAAARGLADHAVVRVVGDQQLEHQLAQLLELRRRGLHLHPLGDGRRAGGDRPRRALDLDDAEPAAAEGAELRVVAERRDRDPVHPRRLEDRHRVGDGDRRAVDRERRHVSASPRT